MASSNGYTEAVLKPLIGFDPFCVLIRRGNRRRLYQLASLPVTMTTLASKIAMLLGSLSIEAHRPLGPGE
jgi:hypothetical protein